MATRSDDTGSRLWRGMRSLIFGEDSEQTLRDERFQPLAESVKEVWKQLGQQSSVTLDAAALSGRTTVFNGYDTRYKKKNLKRVKMTVDDPSAAVVRA